MSCKRWTGAGHSRGSCTRESAVPAPSPGAGAPPHLRAPHLDAVVGGVGGTHQAPVGPAVQVRVLPAEAPVARVARLALALEHGVTEVAQEDALRMLVAVVGLVLAGVLGLAHLRRAHTEAVAWREGPRPGRGGPPGAQAAAAERAPGTRPSPQGTTHCHCLTRRLPAAHGPSARGPGAGAVLSRPVPGDSSAPTRPLVPADGARPPAALDLRPPSGGSPASPSWPPPARRRRAGSPCSEAGRAGSGTRAGC